MCYSEEIGCGCIVEYPPKPIPKEDIWNCSQSTDDDWDSETAEEQENLPENY